MGYDISNNITSNQIGSLTIEQSLVVLNAFGLDKSPETVMAENAIDYKVVKNVYKDIEAVKKSVKRAMKGENKQEIDNETGEVIAYNTLPVDEDDLKDQVSFVCLRDFSRATGVYDQPILDAMDLNIREIVDRIVDKTTKGSNDWSEFVTKTT